MMARRQSNEQTSFSYCCMRATAAEPEPDQSEQMEVEKKIQRHIKELSWLPKRFRSRLVTKLVYQFAREDKDLPLGIVAGAAIPTALLEVFARLGFSFCFLVLVYHSSQCHADGYSYYHWCVWCAWIPFQLLATILEIQSFRKICMPKIQVVGAPIVCGIRICFYAWLFFSCCLGVVSQLDITADATFLATMLRVEQCPGGAHLEPVWRSLWQESVLGSLGIDGWVPSFPVMCAICWSLNIVPVLASLMQALPLVGMDGDLVDYDICHDAVPSSPTPAGIDFVDRDDKVYPIENGGWKTNYSTASTLLDGGRNMQNHGAALMSLCEVNAWTCILYKDFDFAIAKARDCVERGNPEAAIPHVMSQTKRQTQRAIVGALTNGVQLGMQMTAVAMIRYNMPQKEINSQTYFSIAMSAIMLWMRTFEALIVIVKATSWEVTIKSQGANADVLKRSILCLGFVVCICIVALSYGVAKYVMIFQCEYSLWNVNGCWVPPLDLANVTLRGNVTMLSK